MQRLGIVWPELVPVVYVPWLAFRTMIQVEGRARRAVPVLDARGEAIRYLVEAREAALLYFEQSRWEHKVLQVPCPSCGRWVPLLFPATHWWACRSCAGVPKIPPVLLKTAEYLCALKLGLVGQPLVLKYKQALRALQTQVWTMNGVVAVAAAASVLHRQIDLKGRTGARLKASAYGPLRASLSVYYAQHTWDMQVCPEAFWHRVVKSHRR